ncbi:MAG: MBL fold metallo-hydrolase [Paracoccaceae bacterium]
MSQPFDPVAGQPLVLEQGLRLVLAPNPSPMTERGTNTYILGTGAVTVLDPGPADPAHLAAILAALSPGETIAQIIVTHAHKDHSPAAAPLAATCGAPILAFGDARAGRSARMESLSDADLGGGEGVDDTFLPDRLLPHGASFEAGGRETLALHTPGHFGNHLCFLWGDVLFSGDHVMGWAPSLVSPPDGDLTDFMASLDLVEATPHRRMYPGHGAPVEDGAARAAALRSHRLMRETAIRRAIEAGAHTVTAVTETVYADTDPRLRPAAARNVLAHLIDLEARGIIGFAGKPGFASPLEVRKAL